MNTLRDTVFLNIRTEYNNKRSDSFLYRYLREGKLKEKCDADPQNEAKYIHRAATDLMYNLGYPLAQKTLKEQVDPTLSQKEIEQRERARQKRRERYKRQKEEKYGKQKEENNGAKKSEKEKQPRTHNTALDLMDAWYADTHRSKNAASHSLFPENEISETDYQKIFEELNKAGKTKAIVPVRIDPLSGEGLYIVGKDLFPRGEFQYAEGYNCGLCIITLFEIQNEDNYGASLSFGFDPEANLGAQTSVREALKFFEVYINEDRANSGYMDAVWRLNGKMPENCPESLKIYFSDYEREDDFEKLTDEDKREAEIDYSNKRITDEKS